MRQFRLWKYSVSHSTLWFRSPKNRTDLTNIDIKFSGVFYVEMLIGSSGIGLSSINPEDWVISNSEREYVLQRIGSNITSNQRLFALHSSKSNCYIGASNVSVSENELDFLEVEP